MTLLSKLFPATSYRVGDLQWYVGSFAISGEVVVKPHWLAANGALVAIVTYQNLFNEIGHAYNPSSPGTNPGGGNFYLPMMVDGATFIPRGGTRFTVRGTRGGAKVIALASDGSQDVSHPHNFNNNFGYAPSSGVGPLTGAEVGPGGLGGAQGRNSGWARGDGGPAAAHQNMPPVRVIGGMIIMF